MSNVNVNNLKNITGRSLLIYFLLTFFTGGIYAVMWLYKNQEELFDEFGSDVWASYLPILSCFCILVGGWAGTSYEDGATGSALIWFVAGVADLAIWIYWSLKMRTAIRQYVAENFGFDYPVNAFLAVVFRSLYIVYVINQLPAEQALNATLKTNIQPQE